jgi:hypothetical protein
MVRVRVKVMVRVRVKVMVLYKIGGLILVMSIVMLIGGGGVAGFVKFYKRGGYAFEEGYGYG